MKRKKSKKKGPVNANKTTYDGIKFASGLEVYMYRLLKKAKIKSEYEKKTYTLMEGFMFDNSCIEKQSNGGGELKDRGKCKVRAITYTPDFEGEDFIIECKGRANDIFPLKWKMFKKIISKEKPNFILYKPQNQSDCNEVLYDILKRRGL